METGLEAFRASPTFRGPVEPLDGHDAAEHLALLYETREEQFAAVVPFLRQGLERGEKCVYIVDETSRETVLAAMRADGVDVDAVVESGMLSFHTADEVYLRNGGFDADEIIEFYGDTIEEVAGECEGLRVAAETAWILDEATDLEEFLKYESKVNDIFEGEDGIALCQYDRTLIPPEILTDIVKTHPHLVYDDTVCHNFYYTPPEEFFGPERPASEVDRMLRTLHDRTAARAELQEREEFLRKLNDVTSSQDRSFEETLRAVLDLGCERFDLELGGMARVDPDDDLFEVEAVNGDHEHLAPGAQVALSETYCRVTAVAETADGVSEAVTVSDPETAGFGDATCYEEFGVETYLGTRIEVDGGPDRTLFFVSTGPRDERFSEAERTFLELVGQWVKYELDRRQRERELRERTEHLSALVETTPECIKTVAADGTLLQMNPAGLEMVEADAESDVVGECVYDLIAPEDREAFREFNERVCEGERGTLEFDVVGLEGTRRHMETHAAPLHRPDGTTAHVALTRDVTEQVERERFLRELQAVTADGDRSFEEKVEDVLELGCEWFDLDLGALNRVDADADRLEVEHAVGDHSHFEVGVELPLSQTYCQAAADIKEAATVSDPVEDGFDDILVYEEFGVGGYLGTYIPVEGGADRTLAFVPEGGGSEVEPFSEEDRTLLDLMGQWVSYEFDRRKREERLSALNSLTREVMDAETGTDVAASVADAAVETLDLPVLAVALYDESDGALSPAAQTDAAEPLLSTSLFDVGEGAGWQAFVEGDARVVSDPFGDADAASPAEVAVFPLGNHGLLVAGSTAADGFTPAVLDFAETVAANTEAALDRADREQQLQDREAALEEQNETLARLNRVNDIIRSIDQALVQASTRSEIEAVVCEKLAGQGPYELAWVGEHDSVTDEITPRESAGAAKGYLDAITVTAGDGPEGQGPAGRAVRTGEPQVVNNVLDDESFRPWRQEALNRGYHASITLPLAYDGTPYGVLNVYADRPGVFGDLERSVLAELSDTIAYAINAVESKKALVSDEVTELEFEVPASDFPVAAASADLGCEMTLENVVPQTDGGFRLFFSVRGASASAFRDAAPRLPVEDLTLVSEHEADGESVCLFSARPTDENLAGTVLDHGGVPRDLVAADGTATVRVDFAADRDVRELVSMFASNYPNAELVAQRSRERTRRTATEFRAALADELTDRQLEVLQTAYVGGYFETPRTRTGSEIASSLDISQPTFNTHVRAAHRKLCQLLFEHDAALDASGGQA